MDVRCSARVLVHCFVLAVALGCNDGGDGSSRGAMGGRAGSGPGGGTGMGGSGSMAGNAGTEVAGQGASAGASGAGSPPGSSGEGGAAARSLCVKYGGPSAVEQVVKTNVIGAIAGDCRVSPFFTELSAAALTRVGDCLATQVQELFGCEGVTYAGSMASNGLPCRSMRETHRGLGISKGDFDALIEDVVAGLGEAGVEQPDIAAAAPALLGLEEDIVERPVESAPTRAACGIAGAAGGAP